MTTPPALWDFMLAVYDLPGVAPACLDLQDTFGVDVPLLLATLHGAGCGLRIDAAAVALLDTRCAKWRGEVVQPLRRVRMQMKTHPWMAENSTVPPFREAIKALELRAEKIETLALEQALNALPPSSTPERSAATLLAAASCVVDHFAPQPPDETPPGVTQVADAAWSLVRHWTP